MAAVAGLAVCQSATNNSDWKSVVISVNETAIEDTYQDFLELNDLYEKTTKAERKDVRRALANAYKNTAGKLILNFGKTVVPVV